MALGWLAGRGLHWDQVLEASTRLSPLWVLLALLVFIFSNLCRAYRWRVLFVSERITTLRLFVIENVGLGVNSLLPVRVASEAVQFTLLTVRDRITAGTALATLGMTRIMDIWASTLLLALGFLFLPDRELLARYAAGALMFSLLMLLLVLALARSGGGPAFLRRVKLIAAFSHAIAEMERHKRRLLASVFISLGLWVCLGACGWIVAMDMGIPLTLPQAVLVVIATIFFATSAPSLPGGIGTFEFAMIFAMEQFFNVDKNVAFPYALVMHVLLFLPPMALAGVLLPREGISLFSALRSNNRDDSVETQKPAGEGQPTLAAEPAAQADEGLRAP